MQVDPVTVVRALGLPESATAEVEPLGEAAASPVLVAFCSPGVSPRTVLVRQHPDAERAQNHLAVMEALTRRAFPFAPRLLAVAGDAAIEEWQEATTALTLDLPAAAFEAGCDALAAFHALPLREGLDWERSRVDLLPPAPPPLHRLGYAAGEREAAAPGFLAAREALLSGPFGFAHREATATRVRFAAAGPLIDDFSAAGLGHQLFDVAAFLLTSGRQASERRVLAERYAAARALDRTAIADLTDLAGIVWGVEELLLLPRRLIEALGDDTASEAIRLAAARIDAGMRESAGQHPAAAAIRAALRG